MSDIRLHEILTRAVVGRGDRRVVWSHTAPAEGAESVLGVHVSNLSLSVEEGAEAQIQVSAACDLWLDFGEETRVLRLTCSHSEPATVPLSAQVIGATETKANLTRPARCLAADVKDGQLTLKLETYAVIEVSGTARFWVKTYDLDERTDEYDDVREEESLSGSSSDSSDSETSASYFPEEEADGSGEQAEEAELATLAGNDPLPSPPPPPEPVPVKEAYLSRRTAIVSRFPQTARSARISVIQGS